MIPGQLNFVSALARAAERHHSLHVALVDTAKRTANLPKRKAQAHLPHQRMKLQEPPYRKRHSFPGWLSYGLQRIGGALLQVIRDLASDSGVTRQSPYGIGVEMPLGVGKQFKPHAISPIME